MSSNSGLLSLKWQAQPEQLQQSLERMYQNLNVYQGLSDVTLVSSEGEMIEAHSAILAMISPYFQRVFTKVLKNKRSVDTVVILGSVKSFHLKAVLKFIYTGKADISSNDVNELKEVAKTFGIEGLCSAACGQQTHGTRKSTTFTVATNSCDGEDGGGHDGDASHFFGDFQDGASENEVEPYSEPEMKPRTSTNNIVQKVASSDESNSSSNNDDSDSSYNHDGGGGGGKRKRKKRKRVDRRLDPKTGMLIGFQGQQHNWTKRTDEVTKEELESCWTKRMVRDQISKTVFIYYCKKAARNKCPVMMKREECKQTKEVTYYINDAEHHVTAHRNKPFGLRKEDKEFLSNLTREGTKYVTPTEAMEKFKKAGRETPPKTAVESFLKNLRRKKLKALSNLAGHPSKTEEIDAAVFFGQTI